MLSTKHTLLLYFISGERETRAGQSSDILVPRAKLGFPSGKPGNNWIGDEVKREETSAKKSLPQMCSSRKAKGRLLGTSSFPWEG